MKTSSVIGVMAALCGLAAGSGCTTLGTQQRMEAVRREQEVDRLDGDVAKLKERVEALAVSQQQLYQQMEAARDDNARTRQQMADLDRALKALDDSQKAGRQEMVDTMVKRVSEILSRAPASRSPSSPSSQGARAERGYEHVVQAGQTLSEIAAAYKVKPQDIIKANKLDKPNALRVGQKLFIPEP